MQGGLSHERNVSLPVCLSVNRVDCDKTKESSAQIFIPNYVYPSFPTRRMFGRGLLPEISGQADLVAA